MVDVFFLINGSFCYWFVSCSNEQTWFLDTVTFPSPLRRKKEKTYMGPSQIGKNLFKATSESNGFAFDTSNETQIASYRACRCEQLFIRKVSRQSIYPNKMCFSNLPLLSWLTMPNTASGSFPQWQVYDIGPRSQFKATKSISSISHLFHFQSTSVNVLFKSSYTLIPFFWVYLLALFSEYPCTKLPL